MRQFVLEWDKALGWHDNPFQDKIFEPVESFVVGYEKERQRLNLFLIENYKYGVLLGEEGIGKTTLLRWLRSQLKHYKNRFSVVYVNAKNLSEHEFIKTLVYPQLNFFQRWIMRPWRKLHIGNVVEFLIPRLNAKNMIILLDEAHLLSKPDLLILKHIFDSPLPVQLIVAGFPEEMQKSIVSNMAQDRLGITLHGLSFAETKEMLQSRIEALGGHGIEPFDEGMLKHFIREHQNNPRYVLALCSDHAIKLSLKHAFTKKAQRPAEKKMFMIENVEEAEAHDEKRNLTDIFLPGLLEPEKSVEPVAAGSVEETDQAIQQAAAEIEEVAKLSKKKRKKS